MRAQRAGMAIATRPVGATQSGVGQTRESPKQHQVKGQKQGEQREHAQTAGGRLMLVAQPDPGERAHRQQQSHGHQANRRAEVVELLRVHG